jgi:hypothetical protein
MENNEDQAFFSGFFFLFGQKQVQNAKNKNPEKILMWPLNFIILVMRNKK